MTSVKKWMLAFAVCLCMLTASAAWAETVIDPAQPLAEDITDLCQYNHATISKLHDHSYKSFWEAVLVRGETSLIITAPEGKTIGGVLLRWRLPPVALNVQVPGEEEGTWVTVADYDGKYYAQFYPINNQREIRFVPRDNPKADFKLCELTVVTAGALPADFQLWEDPSDKVDLMLVHGHPDDEILWFGGLLPYYGGELQKEVLVMCLCPAGYNRRLELLDCLWACGIRTYPIIGYFHDTSTHSMEKILDDWGENEILAYVTEAIRRHKPSVIVTQDVKGEYGHGVHRATSYAVRNAVELSRDPEKFPEQTEQYGTWDVPKVYIHLYKENQIQMDWNVPLPAFDGMRAMDVARMGLAFHISQTNRGWALTEGGDHDNAIFGLYYSTVGEDVIGGDFFENIE